MMNPEFRRNLWLSFSTHRLIAMPAILGLAFLALALSDRADAANDVYHATTGLFIFIVWLWGTRNANATIVDEFRDKTWDQQRMSALGPWAMTWGKLFGSTAFNWYGGVICLVVLAISGIAGSQPDWPVDLLGLIAVGILLHAALIPFNLHTGQLDMRIIQRGGMGWLVIVFAFLVMQNIILALTVNDHPYSWWGAVYQNKPFMLGGALLFAACAVFGAWRAMSNALQVRTTPWAWPTFALILTVYFAGFSDHSVDTPLYIVSQSGLVVTLLLSYVSLFTEPGNLLAWNRLRLRQQSKDLRGWLEQLPLWPTTLLLSFIFALLATLSHPEEVDSKTLPIFTVPLPLAFMLLRDACIVLFFSFAAHARRPVAAAMLYLIVLNLLLPFFFSMLGLDNIAYFFLPFDRAHGSNTSSLLVMGIHAAIALGLLNWRLNKSRQP